MITIGKAIEESQELLDEKFYMLTPDAIDAIGLGIEAMKAVKLEREIYAFERIATLPGETEE